MERIETKEVYDHGKNFLEVLTDIHFKRAIVPLLDNRPKNEIEERRRINRVLNAFRSSIFAAFAGLDFERRADVQKSRDPLGGAIGK